MASNFRVEGLARLGWRNLGGFGLCIVAFLGASGSLRLGFRVRRSIIWMQCKQDTTKRIKRLSKASVAISCPFSDESTDKPSCQVHCTSKPKIRVRGVELWV